MEPTIQTDLFNKIQKNLLTRFNRKFSLPKKEYNFAHFSVDGEKNTSPVKNIFFILELFSNKTFSSLLFINAP